MVDFVELLAARLACSLAWLFCYDATSSFVFFTNGGYDANQPLVHTLLLNFALLMGNLMFGSYNYGVACFVGISALLTSATLLFSLRFLNRQGVPLPLLLFGFLFFCLNPIVILFSLSTVKDTLFSTAFVLFALLLFQTIQNPKLLKKKSILFTLPALILILLLFRENMLIVLLISSPLLIILCLDRPRMVLVLSAGLLTFFVVSTTLVAIVPLQRGASQSALLLASIPTQQLSRVYNSPDTSALDKQEILTFLGQDKAEALEKYQPKTADAARSAFAESLMVEPDIPGFIALYLAEGTHYPEEYLDAFIWNTYQAYYPFSTIDGYNYPPVNGHLYYPGETSLFACEIESPGELSSKIPWLYDVLRAISRTNILQSNPFTAWIVSVPLMLWLLLLVLCRAIITKNRGALSVCALCVLLVLSILLGPMQLVRYYLYLFYLLPTMIFFLLNGTAAPAPKGSAQALKSGRSRLR